MAAFGAALLLAGPVLAQTGPGPGRAGFEAWDLNHDGRVTWAEAWENIQRRFVEADTDHSGGLSLEEWLAAQLPGRPPRPGQPQPDPQRQSDRRTAMFRAIDANRDNQATLEEMRPVAESWFRAFDANGDGAITPDELPRPRPASR
jgi:hypothetical protein